ncbi:SPOR domain-containing protein [Sphingomonas sp.]|uniref:SPOR domain-containing protein n=1 Tax=Sphingomonas sp. TaxID=28214 RepID=UPI000DB714C4|nr:SPOR domain-containing protein [Sphingomonas sp.]PZU10670.1 MAG: SPOR domain-containing protein [Sphingomonas sp.]
MVEIRRGGSGEAARERLPWLEPVEDEDDYYQAERGGYGGLILAAILVLVAIALITAGVIWYRGHGGASGGSGQIIKAEPGPYKVRPPNPGGMTPDANGEVTYDTSAGQDVNSPIDLNALPEQPMVGPAQNRPAAPAGAEGAPAPGTPGPAARPAPAPAAKSPALPATPPVAVVPSPVERPKPVPAPPVPAAPPGAPMAGGTGVVQLGAFSSEAKAKQAWKTLSARFAGLRDLGLAISPVKSGDKTLYRLRASGAANAARLCAQLRVAGESCSIVN